MRVEPLRRREHPHPLTPLTEVGDQQPRLLAALGIHRSGSERLGEVRGPAFTRPHLLRDQRQA
ncbi:hypothetical protein ACFWY9_10310 [Amycolatopsis sp. NPDC059027]|uniref:hypothetical protein n=1 Tax=Amycolatopsis sp. NPDC059027 TaxID=3346709 RepID=UPI00366E6F7E